MPLPDNIELLCLAIKKRATSQGEKILEKAKKEAQRILSSGLREAERELEAKRLELKRQAFQDARRITDGAELAARRMIMAAREEIFKKVMDKARDLLFETREKPEAYRDMVKSMIVNARSVVAGEGEGKVVVQAPQRDIPVVKEAAREAEKDSGFQIQVDEQPAEIEGGILVFSLDRRRMVDFSFDALLKRLEPEIRALVAEKVFSGEGS